MERKLLAASAIWHIVYGAIALPRDQAVDDACRQLVVVPPSITGYDETYRHQKHDFALRRLTGPLISRRNSDGRVSVRFVGSPIHFGGVRQ
jgi:hypothetical protein